MRYVLGGLSQDDQTRIEEAFFANDAKFEELEMAEAELIDAYVRDDLSPDQRRQFETKLRNSPVLLERIRFAHVLKERCAHLLSVQAEIVQTANADLQRHWKRKAKWWEELLAQPAFRRAVAAGVFVILAGGVALLFEWRNLRRESDQLAYERAILNQQRRERDRQFDALQTKNEQLGADLQLARDQQAAAEKLNEQLRSQQSFPNSRSVLGTVSSMLLMPGSLRSGGSRPELSVTPRTSTVELKLGLENNEYQSYRATLKSADDATLFRQNRLRPYKTRSGSILILSIPAGRLKPDDYSVYVDGVTLSGQVESVNYYSFRILKRE